MTSNDVDHSSRPFDLRIQLSTYTKAQNRDFMHYDGLHKIICDWCKLCEVATTLTHWCRGLGRDQTCGYALKRRESWHRNPINLPLCGRTRPVPAHCCSVRPILVRFCDITLYLQGRSGNAEEPRFPLLTLYPLYQICSESADHYFRCRNSVIPMTANEFWRKFCSIQINWSSHWQVDADIDNGLAPKGNTPLSKPMMNKFTDTYMLPSLNMLIVTRDGGY